MEKLLVACAALLGVAAAAWGASPRVFFTDLTSGPKSGGQSNAGAFVTIYGRNFGATRGTSSVTIGGGPAASYHLWTDTKIAIQLGAKAVTGNIVVTTPAGASNGALFTVRAGNIYFVATNGSDSSSGKYSSPWRTLMHARDTMRPGDIAYAMNGVAQTADDGSGWQTSLLLRSGGTAAAPMAFVVYPQATATIGSNTGPPSGVRSAPQGESYPNYWVFAGFTLRGQTSAMALWGSAGWRIIANDMSCPNGTEATACMGTVESSSMAFYGNNVHDTGVATASALYHGVYFGTDSNHLDIGWNTIANVHGCRGIQIHSTPQSGEPNSGQNQYDIAIHDNTIHDTQCDGIIVDTVDPSRGPVSIYNNVVYDAGEGPANPENTGGWNCINIPGGTENGPNGSGTVEIFNNTLFACGTFANPPYPSDNNGIAENGDEPEGAPAIYVHNRNNLIYSVATALYPAGVPYFVAWNPVTGELCANTDICPWLYGTNNLLYGAGAPVADLTEIVGSVNRDPLVVSTSLPDLHLTSGSPAGQAGASIGDITVFGIDNTGRDHDGLPRPAILAIGAYEIANAEQIALTVRLATAGQIEPFAADSIVSAYGANLTAGTAQATLPLETALDGVTVTVTDSAGVSRAALLFYVSPTQINCEIPDGTAAGAATVTIANANGTSQTGAIQVGSVSPGLFELNASGLAAAWVLPFVSGVGQNPQAVYQLSSNNVVPLPISLGPPSEEVYLELFGTGIRNAKNVTVTVGGAGVPVLYSGAAPGFAGEDQVNIGPLPQSLAGQASVNILLTADGQAANTVNVTIQ